jgi:hypothetical protein
MQYLKADTAATILIGPFVDATDGVTPETGVTLGGADQAELMKHDGTSFVDISGRTFTHKAGGVYTLALSTADTDTEGRLSVFIGDTDVCLPIVKDFTVVNANVFDSLFAAATTDYLQVDALQVEGSDATDTIDGRLTAIGLDHLLGASVTGTDITDNSIVAKLVSKESTADWDDFDNTTDSLQAMKDGLATSSALADAVWDEAMAGHTTADTSGDYLGDIKTKTDNLPGSIPKNVALSNFMFLMTDDTNHAPDTGLTVTSQIAQDGGALGACTNSASEISNGLYKINLTQAEMNADTIVLRFTATGADDRVILLKTDS